MLFHEECLRDWRRISKPGRLDDDGVKRCDFFVKAFERFDEVSPHRAADATCSGEQITLSVCAGRGQARGSSEGGAKRRTVHHLHDILVRVLPQNLVIHADVAKLIFYDGKSHAVVGALQDMVQQGRFAGS